MNGALALGMFEADAARRLAPLGIEPVGESPEAFRRYIAEDVARNARLLREADFQPE